MKFFILFTCLLLAGKLSFAQTTYFSKASGAWNNSATWNTTSCGGAATNSGTFPVTGDIVTICSGHTVTLSALSECGSLTVNSGGIITTTANDATTDHSTLNCSNNCTIAGSINVNGNGSPGSSGTHPGTDATGSCLSCDAASGGGHGGAGGKDAFAAYTGGASYGSSTAPVELGSGGGKGNTCGTAVGGAGGGMILIKVINALSVTGTISANGNQGGNDFQFAAGGGAGGSIYICAGTFSNTGTITANGGDGGTESFCACSPTCQYGGGGGGGIISIIVAAATATFGSPTVTGGAGIFSGANGPAVNEQTNAVNCNNGLLPIELLSFNAQANQEIVDLTWVTATETNNDFFTVERSTDGINFEKVTIVKGVGNSSIKLNYSAIDNSPYQGVSYYRLKQTDFDGKYTYSKTVPVSFYSDLFVSPNPINLIIDKNITLRLSGLSKEAEVMVKFYDILEQTYFSKILATDSDGNAFANIENNTFPAAGVYLVSVLDNNKLLHKKVVVE